MAIKETGALKYAADHTRSFLRHLGIQADVQVDDNNQPLIIMETEQFQRHQDTIETWFTLIEQIGDKSYFAERPRRAAQPG